MEESIKIPSLMKEALQLEPIDVCSYSPLALAYMGDAVYEVLIRTRVMNRGSMQVNKMHKKSASLVKAEAQARMIQALQEELTEEEKELVSQLSSYEEKFDAAMDDDLNTADALAAIFELVRFANTHAGEESSKAFLSALKEKIVSLSDVLGLIAEKKEEMLDADIEALIEERQAARKARNFARADEIRNELLSKGIVLEDTREGVKWKRA